MLNVDCRPAARTTSPQRNGRTRTRNERPGLRSHIMALKSILAISSADSQDKSSAELSSRRGGAALIRYIAMPQGYFARVQVNLPKILVGGAQESH